MKQLVESCFHLDTKLLKKALRRAREHKTATINGFINISHGNVKAVADYYIDSSTEHDYLVINYGQGEQRIKLAESELYFGTRSWFICNCERRVAKLYLPPKATLFKCRHCYSLTYELNTFSRESPHGLVFYRTNRMIKMINNREKMRSYLYNGKPTLRFDRFLKLSELAGFQSNIDDAKALLSDINSFN